MPDVRPIDGNALVKTIESVHCKDCNNYNGVMCRACKWMDAMDYIEDAPTIDAQPVKNGKWEWEPGYVGTTAKCSVCGLSPRGFYSLPISQIGRLPEYKFCPNCGAKMDGCDADA